VSKLTFIETHIIILIGNGIDCSFVSFASKMCTITPVCDIHSRHILCALGLFIFLKHLKTAKTKIPNIHFYPTTTMFIHIQADHNLR